LRNDIKIIDFRVRPPITAYKLLFDVHPKRGRCENKFVAGPENAISPSMHKVGENAGLDLLVKEIDEAGIDLVVAPGRAPGRATPAGLQQDFPKLNLLLAHGGYPAVIETLALAVKHSNFYLSPDVYCTLPAGELYVNAISKLPDQFVFASAHLMAGLKESVEDAEIPVVPRCDGSTCTATLPGH
jgi:hypothetical protein